MIDVATSFNLLKYLFAKNIFKQSLRLEFLNAWTSTYFDFVKLLTNVKQKKNFIRNFLFISKQILNDDDVEKIEIQKNAKHVFVRLFMFVFKLNVNRNNYFSIRSHVNFSKLSFNHSFFETFENAFEQKYDIKKIMNWKFKRLKWKKKLIYIDFAINRRWIFKIENYVIVRKK